MLKVNLNKKLNSVKEKNGVSPASKVIRKTKKGASCANTEDAVESRIKIKSELHSESFKVKSEPAESNKTRNGTKVAKQKPAKKGATDTVESVVKMESESAEIETKTGESNEMNDTEVEEETPAKEGAKKSKGEESTIFIANLPTTMKKSQIKTLFSTYGDVQTVRIRRNDGLPIYHRKDLKNVLSLIAYVRFSTKEEMEKACAMNGQLVGENRIRVCPEGKKQIGNIHSTVFVGNIKQGTTENELYDFFRRVGPMEYVRLIANKNFAFVCFKQRVSIKEVLKLDQQLLNDRPLRVQRMDKERTNVKLNKKGNVVKRRKLPFNPKKKNDGAATADKRKDAKANDDFHGKLSEAKKKKNFFKSAGGSARHTKMLASKLKAAMQKLH